MTNEEIVSSRTNLNMTSREFCLRFGFGYSTYRKWEKGEAVVRGSDLVLLILIREYPDLVLRIASEVIKPFKYTYLNYGKDLNV
jgi:DNA-binding transcriptional regulator YiaG